jgi:hypothetical protein
MLEAFGEGDWQRFLWWGRAVVRGCGHSTYNRAVRGLLPLFERGELGRVLHTVGQTMREEERVERERLCTTSPRVLNAEWQRVAHLHRAMLGRARRAVDCWSMAARRHRVLKDIRLVISRMAHEQPWLWHQQETAAHKTAKRTQ